MNAQRYCVRNCALPGLAHRNFSSQVLTIRALYDAFEIVISRIVTFLKSYRNCLVSLDLRFSFEIVTPDLFLDQAVRLRISGSCLGEFDDQWYGCRAYCGPLSVGISSGGPHMMNHWADLLIIDCIFLTR